MEFKDLKFKKQTHGGIGTTAKFKDVTISIQAGSFVYSTPREDGLDSTEYCSFEVGIFENTGDGGFVTSKYIDCGEDLVAGWVSKEEIENVLQKLN
jgi:hypothetical protein